MADPYLAYALISSWFDSAEPRDSFVHPSAVLDVTAKVADNVYVGPNVVIEGGRRCCFRVAVSMQIRLLEPGLK